MVQLGKFVEERLQFATLDSNIGLNYLMVKLQRRCLLPDLWFELGVLSVRKDGYPGANTAIKGVAISQVHLVNSLISSVRIAGKEFNLFPWLREQICLSITIEQLGTTIKLSLNFEFETSQENC